MRSGFSLIGLLVAMACVVVLFAVLMTSMNKAVTGEGSARVNTLRSLEDKQNLYAIMTSLIAYANDHEGWYLVPSQVAHQDDRGLDTTANFYSAMVALRYIQPHQLIAGNEFSAYVEPDDDYDYLAFDPRQGTYWDPAFVADLSTLSNASYAHLPMFGGRYEQHWKQSLSSAFPVVGNRGPKNGVDDPQSFTYGRADQWAGHLGFGDGHIEFVSSFTPAGMVRQSGAETQADNIFAMEDGPQGDDVVLAFTREMTAGGPVLQWD